MLTSVIYFSPNTIKIIDFQFACLFPFPFLYKLLINSRDNTKDHFHYSFSVVSYQGHHNTQIRLNTPQKSSECFCYCAVA